jgi:GNAT superfamily N-acetyltransferase
LRPAQPARIPAVGRAARLRRAVPSDLRPARSDRFACCGCEDGAGCIPWVAEKQALARENAGLAVLDGEPAGIVLVGPWPDDPVVGYVHHYYLEPHAPGRGLGSELDAYAVRALLRQGHCTARLSVA